MAMIAAGAMAPMVKEIVSEKNVKKMGGVIKWLLVLGSAGVAIGIFIWYGSKKGWFKNPFSKILDPLGITSGASGIMKSIGGLFGAGGKFKGTAGMEGLVKMFAGKKTSDAMNKRIDIRKMASGFTRSLEGLKKVTKDKGTVGRIDVIQSVFKKAKDVKTIDTKKLMENTFDRKVAAMPKVIDMKMDKKGNVKVAKKQQQKAIEIIPRASSKSKYKPIIKLPTKSKSKKRR